jgi:hypothetical protein
VIKPNFFLTKCGKISTIMNVKFIREPSNINNDTNGEIGKRGRYLNYNSASLIQIEVCELKITTIKHSLAVGVVQ